MTDRPTPHERNAYLETRITAPISAEALVERIEHPAFLGAWEDHGFIHLYWDSISWTEQILSELREALRQLGTPNAEITVHDIPGQDWNVRWAASVQPIRIGRRVVVRPTWQPVPLADHEVELILDPKQAFGTGHHATTQLLVEWLDDHIHEGERILDIGTGSGILAMAALRFGAVFALGVDHDRVAIACAMENAALNHFGPELVFEQGTLDDLSPTSFDVIVANLDCQTILSLYDRFQRFAHETTVLLLSGVLQDDEEAIIQAGALHGWMPMATREREGWLAIGLQRETRSQKVTPLAAPNTRSRPDT